MYIYIAYLLTYVLLSMVFLQFPLLCWWYSAVLIYETNRLVWLQACLKYIKTWKTQNFLLLNSSKTEVIIIGPEGVKEKLSSYIITLDGISLACSTTVRNLEVIFDQNLRTYKTGF